MADTKYTMAPTKGEKPKDGELKAIGKDYWQFKKQTGQWHLLYWNTTFGCWNTAL